jgi:hypothetical protein
MDAGPDNVRSSADLGPISPELALVDPLLAARARRLLPDPVDSLRPRPPRPVVVAETPSIAPPVPHVPGAEQELEPEPAGPGKQRRWARTLALAVIVFVGGAISGTFLGGNDSTSPGVTFQVRGDSTTSNGPRLAESSTTTGARPALSPPDVSGTRHAGRAVHIIWAANVLGVEARPDGRGVTIVWNRPADSGHVVVLRARGAHRGMVVFRGRAARYRDASTRPCTAYRYTIVNYDRRGHHSTGVPTSIVTRGCAA